MSCMLQLVERNPGGLSWSLPGFGALPTDAMPLSQSNDDALCNELELVIKPFIWSTYIAVLLLNHDLKSSSVPKTTTTTTKTMLNANNKMQLTIQ